MRFYINVTQMSGQAATYTVSAQSIDTVVNQLTNAVAFPSQIGQYQYDHYSFEVVAPTLTTQLLVVLYIDEGQEGVASLFANIGQLAGLDPCYSNIYTSSNDTKIVYVVPPCEVQEGTYYFSVSTLTALLEPLRYTLTVTTTDIITNLNLNDGVLIQNYPSENLIFQFNVTYSNDLELSIAFGNPTGDYIVAVTTSIDDLCECFFNPASIVGTTAIASGIDKLITLDWCDLPSDVSTYYILIGNDPANSILEPSSVTLLLSSQTYSITPMAQSFQGVAASNNYSAFSLPCTNAFSIVYITFNSSTQYLVYGNSMNLATQACGSSISSTFCDSFSRPCYVLPCDEFTDISVASPRTTQPFQGSYVVADIVPYYLNINQSVTRSLTYDTHYYSVILPNSQLSNCLKYISYS